MQGPHLCEVILHDVPDNAKLIKVASPPLSAKGLLEAYLHIGDEVSVPRWRQELIGKSAKYKLRVSCFLEQPGNVTSSLHSH